MNSIKTQMHQFFNVLVIALMYWVFIHAVIAVHSNFFPLITRFLSLAPWYITLTITGLLCFVHITCKNTFDTLFEIDLKSNISIKDALHSLSRYAPSKQKYLMALSSFYILTCGSMISGLLASFFSFHHSFAKWIIYIVLLSVVLFLLKQLISTWAKSYLNAYGV